jgi:hypothetical protein
MYAYYNFNSYIHNGALECDVRGVKSEEMALFCDLLQLAALWSESIMFICGTFSHPTQKRDHPADEEIAFDYMWAEDNLFCKKDMHTGLFHRKHIW